MSNEQRQQRRPAEAIPSDDDFQRLLERDAKTTASYIPYGAKDEIRLTVTTVQNLIAVRTKRGHTCSHRDALKFIAMCKAKRLNPFEGDCFLIGYDGADGPTFALVTAHQTYLKRAELHDEFDGMESGLIVKDDEGGKLSEIEGDFYEPGQRVVGGWAKVYFKNRKHPMYKRLRMERFNSGFAQWKVDAAGMICKCAEADALRSAFPTMLGGLYMEDEKQPDSPKMAKPDFSKPAATPLFGKAPDTTSAPEAEPEPEPQIEEPPFTDTGEGTDLGPQTPTQPTQPSSGQPNYLKGVRDLCKMSKIKETTLLGFWSGTGSTDGSQSTLEEVQISSPDVMRLTFEQWQDISGRILAAQKAGAK